MEGKHMNRETRAAAILATVIGAATAATALPALAQNEKLPPGANAATVGQNMQRAQQDNLAKCYGINALARNDCATASHACAGQSTKASDPKSFVLLPRGDCAKIAGGVEWTNG
jgi:uncharacterized membrane protein